MRDRRYGLVAGWRDTASRIPRLLMGCGEPLGGGSRAVLTTRGRGPRRGARQLVSWPPTGSRG